MCDVLVVSEMPMETHAVDQVARVLHACGDHDRRMYRAMNRIIWFTNSRGTDTMRGEAGCVIMEEVRQREQVQPHNQNLKPYLRKTSRPCTCAHQ